MISKPQRGFGAAWHAGLSAAIAEVVDFCDCDASPDPRQLPRAADPVLDDSVDLALAYRSLSRVAPGRCKGGWPTGSWHDVISRRAGRRADLPALELTDRRCGYGLEILVHVADAGRRVCEVEVDHLPRIGRSKVTGTMRGVRQAVRDMSAVLTR